MPNTMTRQATSPAGTRHIRRTGLTSAMAVLPLFKRDSARRIDRVIDYFGGFWLAPPADVLRERLQRCWASGTSG